MKLLDKCGPIPGTKKFFRALECSWHELRPIVPIPIVRREYSTRAGKISPESARAHERKSREAEVLHRRIFRETLGRAGGPEEQIDSSALFIRRCRAEVYGNLYGPTSGPERQRERAFLRALAENKDLVLAFFALYRRLLYPIDWNNSWRVFSDLLSQTRDPDGFATGAKRAEPESSGVIDFPASTALPKKFSWPTYYGAFTRLSEVLAFSPPTRTDMPMLRSTFIECAARQEVCAFLDLSIRMHLLNVLMPLHPDQEIEDEAATSRFLRKFFLVERDHVDRFVSHLGSKERVVLARVGLFSPRTNTRRSLLKKAMRIVSDIEVLSNRWYGDCLKGKSGQKFIPEIRGLRSLFHEALQTSVSKDARKMSSEGASYSGGIIAVIRESFRKKIVLLARSIEKRTGRTKQAVGAAVREGFSQYIQGYRLGTVPLDAWIHKGFESGGHIYHRAIKALLKRERHAVKADYKMKKELLIKQIEFDDREVRLRLKRLSPRDRWVFRYKSSGMSNKDVAARLRKKFPKLDNKMVFRIWKKCRGLLGPRWHKLEAEEKKMLAGLKRRIR